MEKTKTHNKSRRQAINSGLAGVASLAIGAAHSQLQASTSHENGANINMEATDLIKILRAMDREVCDTAALNIEESINFGSDLYLHLRDAGLNTSNALALAEALTKHSTKSRYPLRSFSVSNNPDLSDSSVAALAQSLPQTLHEIGFVDCNIHDKGGEAILEWANQAPELKMICIELNNFTNDAKSRFQAFSHNRPDVTVFF